MDIELADGCVIRKYSLEIEKKNEELGIAWEIKKEAMEKKK